MSTVKLDAPPSPSGQFAQDRYRPERSPFCCTLRDNSYRIDFHMSLPNGSSYHWDKIGIFFSVLKSRTRATCPSREKSTGSRPTSSGCSASSFLRARAAAPPTKTRPIATDPTEEWPSSRHPTDEADATAWRSTGSTPHRNRG